MRAGIALVVLTGVLAAQTPKPEPKGAIRGSVKDTTGIPVAGTSVRLVEGEIGPGGQFYTNGNAPPNSSLTDEAGNYEFTGLRPGTYSVKTERDPAASRQIKIDAGQEVTLDLVVPANQAISGRVLDENKDPAVDAFVWLLKPEYQAGILRQVVIGPKVTGEDGTYSFDSGLEANRRYYVLVDRQLPEELATAAAADLTEREPIEVPTYFPSATRMDSASPLVLQPGESREQVDIRIATAAFYCIEGKIQVSGAAAASDFVIQETPLAGTRLARLRRSAGEDGKYHVCGLSPGRYRLSIEEGFTEFAISSSDIQHMDLSGDTAHLSLQVDWEGPPPIPDVPQLDAGAEATLRKIAAQMGMGDAPSDDDLKKLAMRLRQSDPSDSELWQAFMRMQSDDNFRFEMRSFMRQLHPVDDRVTVNLTGIFNNVESPVRDSVPAGDYAVNVWAPGDSYVKEMTFNELKLAGGSLRLAPATSGTLRVLLGSGTATLTIAVADVEGKPAPDATVIVVPDSVTSVVSLSANSIRGNTDQKGNYTSRPLAPGKYRVLATSQAVRWGVPEDLEKVMLVLFQAKEVELDAKAKVQIAVQPVPIY
jgi:protocatechuate 3,4-dioxygenase beta subunit